MSKRHSKPAVALLFSAALGCGAPVGEQEELPTAPEEETPAATISELGMTWVPHRKVEYVEYDSRAVADRQVAGQVHSGNYDPAAMSLAEVIEKFSPVMEFEGTEYVLDDESKSRFARGVQQAAIAEAAREEQGGGAQDAVEVDQPEFSTPSDRVGRKVIAPATVASRSTARRA